VAIFHLQITPVARGATGRTATDAAAYRAGERIVNTRNGAVSDHSHRRDVVHREIVLPNRFSAVEVGWARDRQALWNAVERSETRRNARVAREYQLALPSELDSARRQALTIAFSRDIAERYGVAVDVAIHAPTATGDARNHHAHLLTTTRELTQDGFGRKVGLDMQEDARLAQGLKSSREEFREIRGRLAELTNEALREAGLEERVDHRTLAAQGIDREPKHQPYHIYKAAQRTLGAAPVERARELYRERASPEPAPPVLDRPTLEDIQRTALENWAAYRAAIATEGKTGPETSKQLELSKEPSNALAAEKTIGSGDAIRKRDDDLAL
jgi:hypothetical protein